MKQENFLYFGKRPTNVCYNGVSFPVAPGDVVRCYRAFWEAFVTDPKLYKTIPDNDPRKPKYTFGRSPVFIKPDPTGGLPMQSSSDPGHNPRLKEKMKEMQPISPALVEETDYANPYDLGVDEEPTLEISTAEDKPSAPEPKEETFTTAIEQPEFVTELEPVPEEIEAPEDLVEEDEPGQVEEYLLGRTALRKLTRDEVFDECKRLAALGCPSNPEFLETFESFDEETTRGPMFEQLWDYCGYNE